MFSFFFFFDKKSSSCVHYYNRLHFPLFLSKTQIPKQRFSLIHSFINGSLQGFVDGSHGSTLHSSLSQRSCSRSGRGSRAQPNLPCRRHRSIRRLRSIRRRCCSRLRIFSQDLRCAFVRDGDRDRDRDVSFASLVAMLSRRMAFSAYMFSLVWFRV